MRSGLSFIFVCVIDSLLYFSFETRIHCVRKRSEFMENLLQQNMVTISRPILNRQEECGVSGNFTLPDYCADISSVMSCHLTPHLQHRQWSGDRLLIDGVADVRVLYLDESRTNVHSVEFPLSFSVECKADCPSDAVPVSVDLRARYINWRVISSRCIEVRGAVLLDITALSTEEMCLYETTCLELEAKTCNVTVSAPVCATEKIVTVNEQLDFPQTKPAAEMLLGGHCCTEVTECRVLTGKAIVKGNVHIHQLYTVSEEKGTTDCLDFTIPFSHILDVEGATENQLHSIHTVCLSDTERCLVGPDGSNTVLDVTAKVLIQLCVWDEESVSLLLDAYHTRHPMTPVFKEFTHNRYLGHKSENVMIPAPMELTSGAVAEVIDVCVSPTDYEVTAKGQIAVFSGRFQIVTIVRDADQRIQCLQKYEDFRIDIPCNGDLVNGQLTVLNVRYHVEENCVNLQIQIHCCLDMYQQCCFRIISGLDLQDNCVYDENHCNLLVYYASPGESVWEIGRSCHASAKNICEENALTEDTIQVPTLLTIPL